MIMVIDKFDKIDDIVYQVSDYICRNFHKPDIVLIKDWEKFLKMIGYFLTVKMPDDIPLHEAIYRESIPSYEWHNIIFKPYKGE